MTTDNLHDMTRGYIEAALWADAERMECAYCRSGQPPYPVGHHAAQDCPNRQESGGLEHLEVRAEDYAYVFALCERFAVAAGDDLETFANLRSFDPAEGTVWHYIGHDLRLTSGGHGTGFWDRDADSADADEHDCFDAAKLRLAELARSRPFDRSGGGDVWQVSDMLANFDHWSLDADAAPGARWEAPALTSAQRQAWIESGIVPTVAETFPT